MGTKMKSRIIFICAVLISLSGVGHAAEEKKVLKLTGEQMMILVNGLTALDGYDRIIKDGAIEKTGHESYKLGCGLRLLIGRDLTALRAAMQPIYDAQRALLFEKSNNTGEVKPDSPEEKQFNMESFKIMLSTAEIELYPIPTKELKLDENPIPGSVLSSLGLILED
jgi:hypothetical protein